MTLRFQAMAVAIAAGVGVFLGAQELRLIPQAWSEESNATRVSYASGGDVASYTSAISARPDDFMSYYRRGLHYQAVGQLDLALADLDRAVALSPTPATRRMLGVEAQDTLSPQTRTLNRVVFVRLMRANVLTRLERENEALADLDQALVLDGRKTSAIFARAALLTSLERFDEALADYDALLARHPDPNWSFGRGVAKYHAGDVVGAAEDFRNALRGRPQDSEFQDWFAKASLRATVAAQ